MLVDVDVDVAINVVVDVESGAAKVDVVCSCPVPGSSVHEGSKVTRHTANNHDLTGVTLSVGTHFI